MERRPTPHPSASHPTTDCGAPYAARRLAHAAAFRASLVGVLNLGDGRGAGAVAPTTRPDAGAKPAGWHPYSNGVRANLKSRNGSIGGKTLLPGVSGTDGPLAETPLQVTYQLRWWLPAEPMLDDAGAL